MNVNEMHGMYSTVADTLEKIDEHLPVLESADEYALLCKRLKGWEKQIKDIDGSSKEALIPLVKMAGDEESLSTTRLATSHATVDYITTEHKEPPAKRVEELEKELGLEEHSLFDAETKVVYTPSKAKLQKLLLSGKIDKERYKKIFLKSEFVKVT